jgi:hypothetical protein
MTRWLWKQKYRVDRGSQLIALVNLGLLLTQSETLKSYLGLTTSSMVLLGLPLCLTTVWGVGYLMTLPSVQQAEDRAQSDMTQVRRDLDEILQTLRRKDM